MKLICHHRSSYTCITVLWFKIIVTNTKLIFSPSSFDTVHFCFSLSRIIFGIYTSSSTYLNFSLIQKLCLIYVYQQYFSFSFFFFFYIRIFGKKVSFGREHKRCIFFATLHKWILPVIQCSYVKCKFYHFYQFSLKNLVRYSIFTIFFSN